MENKMKHIAVSVIMVAFFLGFSVFCLLKPADDFSDSERRGLARAPLFKWESVFSGKFMTDFEKYSLDQFPMRDAFRGVKAVVSNYVFGQKDNNGIYVKDGYAAKMEYPYNEASVAYAAKRFQYVYDKFLKGTDAKSYLSIIPDKHYYLNEGERLELEYDRLFADMAGQMSFAEYIDITGTLSLDSFYKTDTHWRQEKLIPTAGKLAEDMGVKLSGKYREEILEKDFYGVYYGQAALPLQADKMRYLTNDVLDEAKVYDFQNNKEIEIYDMEKAFGKDPYEIFLSGSLSLLTIENAQATTEKELVIFRDSFGSSIAPLFAEGYKKITMVDIRYMHPNVLERFIEFDHQDVLFLYSTLVLNNSEVLK